MWCEEKAQGAERSTQGRRQKIKVTRQKGLRDFETKGLRDLVNEKRKTKNEKRYEPQGHAGLASHSVQQDFRCTSTSLSRCAFFYPFIYFFDNRFYIYMSVTAF